MECKCRKCSHVWWARGGNKPAACPKCKTYYWEKEKEKKKKKE